LGVDPFDAPGLFGGFAPYLRAAIEPHWGNRSLMVGTFGMYTEWRATSHFIFRCFPLRRRTMETHSWPLQERRSKSSELAI
jgi:hypothetical protein